MSVAPAAPAEPDLPVELDAAALDVRGPALEAYLRKRTDLSERRASQLQLVESRLEGVAFRGAVLAGASFRDVVAVDGEWANLGAEGARLRRVRLEAGNPERLRGVRMPWPDVVNSAGELAAAVGIEIIEQA